MAHGSKEVNRKGAEAHEGPAKALSPLAHVVWTAIVPAIIGAAAALSVMAWQNSAQRDSQLRERQLNAIADYLQACNALTYKLHVETEGLADLGPSLQLLDAYHASLTLVKRFTANQKEFEAATAELRARANLVHLLFGLAVESVEYPTSAYAVPDLDSFKLEKGAKPPTTDAVVDNLKSYLAKVGPLVEEQNDLCNSHAKLLRQAVQ